MCIRELKCLFHFLNQGKGCGLPEGILIWHVPLELGSSELTELTELLIRHPFQSLCVF
jgi:hypothetical protein